MPDRDKIQYETSLESLLISIVKQAQEDGRITLDESELINRIQIDARDFEAEIVKASRENTGEPMEEIYKVARARMIENATATAKADGAITTDEEAIINKLIQGLDAFNE